MRINRETSEKRARFEVLTELLVTFSVIWDITPCGALKVQGRFEKTSGFHLQG
jgi:hypothetical protein